jgi:hypothetical protein
MNRLGGFNPLKLTSKREVAYIVIFVSARYHVPGETIMRQTDRAFRIDYVKPGEEDDDFKGFGIPLPIPDDFSTKRVRLRGAGHNRAT